MTPDMLQPFAPRLLQWMPCPVCTMLFKDVQGRGGHLRHMRDPAHTAYRAQNGLAKPKRSRYPDSPLPVSPRAAPTPPAFPPDDEIPVLDFGEPQQFSVLLEDEPDPSEALAPVSPVQQFSASPPVSSGDVCVPVAQAPAQGASPQFASPSQATASPALPPASPTQAIRPASPEAPQGYGQLSEAGEAPRQGDPNARRQAPALAPSYVSPSLGAQAMPASVALPASPPPAPSVQAPASPKASPALSAQAVRLASSEAPIGYDAPGEAGEAHTQDASIQAKRPKAGEPAQPPAPSAHAKASQASASPTPAPKGDWANPKALPVALRALSNSLMQTSPSPHLGKLGRRVCLAVVLGVAGLALYFSVRQLKGVQRTKAEAELIDASRLTPGAPPRRTGDPYWDRLLGYTE